MPANKTKTKKKIENNGTARTEISELHCCFWFYFFFFSRVFYLFKHETQAIIVTRSQDTFEGQRGLWFLVSGFWSLTTRRELWWSWSLVLRPSAG